METINHKKFFYPPGGILIWIIILLEVVTFCAGIITFAWQSNSSPDIFEVSQNTLNTKIGLVNTLLLLTSGFFVAESVRYLKIGEQLKSQGVYHEKNFLDIESGAAFWHMCDIIWLLLFPVLYLL